MSIQVTCPLLAGNDPAPCSITTIKKLHEFLTTRQCALPNAETATILFRALMASGQITMRRVDGWQTLDQAPVKQPIDLAA